MILIVGLGNPGNLYELTRHNIGFMAIDNFINSHKLDYSIHKKSNSLLSNLLLTDRHSNKQSIIFSKPQTYMNLSGQTVANLASYYKISPNKILIIHDDVDINLGKVKFKIGGGNAGHNGLKSIDQILGNNYCRLRIGIGKPIFPMELSNYVLSKFSSEELDILKNLLDKITNLLPIFFAGEIEDFQRKINNL